MTVVTRFKTADVVREVLQTDQGGDLRRLSIEYQRKARSADPGDRGRYCEMVAALVRAQEQTKEVRA